MVPLLHHLRRQPPIPLCIERSTCHYDGKYRMESGSLCSHSFRNNRRLPCLSRLRPRFHSVWGVSVIHYILRNIHQTVTTDSQYIENYTVLNKNILIKTKIKFYAKRTISNPKDICTDSSLCITPIKQYTGICSKSS